MLTTEFTPILTKDVTIPASGFVNATVYLLVTNTEPTEPRIVEFFLEIGPFQSISKTIGVNADGSKLTILPVEIAPGEYPATLYAKADMEGRISVTSSTVAVK